MGRPRTTCSYNALLHSAIANKDLDHGQRIHQLISHDGLLSYDPLLCARLIRMYAACGRLLYARQAFFQTYSPSVFTWSAIIAVHSKVGQVENALGLFCEMQRANVKPDKHILLAVLKGCSSVAALEYCRLIHFLAMQNRLEADVALSNCLIDSYAKCKRFPDARKVFDDKIEKDTITWSSLTTGFAQHGYGYDTLTLYSQMIAEGATPNRVTFISVLKACCNTGMLIQCKFAHACLREMGLEADLVICNTLIDVYAKCGGAGLNEAHRVFRKLLKKDAVSWNALIGAYTQHGHGEKAFQLFEKMYQQDINPDKFTIVSMLQACSSVGALKEGKLIYAYFVESGFPMDNFIINSLVDMYAKCGDLDEAQRLFDRLPARSVVTWSAMIAGHVQNSQNQKAFEVFLQMQREKKKPDNFTYGSILKACSNMKDLNKGKVLHEHVIENSATMDVVVGSALMDMYIKCHSLEDARTLFDKLLKRDVVTWSAMITGYVELGGAQEALALYQQMLHEQTKPNGVTFMSSLKACSSIAALYEGTLIHGQIVEDSLEDEKLINNALIDMYGKCGRPRDADKIFSFMSNRDLVTWNALISGHALHSDYESAVKYFGSMQQEGIQPDDITFLSLLSVCNHLGLIDEGQQHFKSMSKVFGVIPAVEHYNCMIDLFGRTGHLKEALDLIQLVPFETGAVGWSSLLNNCSNLGNPDVGRQCFDFVVDLDLNHATSYVHMFNIYGDYERWEEARTILDLKMKSAFGWKKPGKAWIEVENKVYDFMVGDKSHPQSFDLFAKLKRLTEVITEVGYIPHFIGMIPSENKKSEAHIS